MAQLSQRRYDSIPNINAVSLPNPIVTNDPWFQSVQSALSPSAVTTFGPMYQTYMGPSNNQVQTVAYALLNLSRDRFTVNPLTNANEYMVDSSPFPGVTGYSSAAGAPSSFGIQAAPTSISQRSFTNQELTNAALNPFAATDTKSSANMFVELYKPSANGVSTTSASTYAVSQIKSSKTIWNDQTNKPELVDTSKSYAGYTNAYTEATYILQKQDMALKLKAGSDPAIYAGYQDVVNFYGGKGIEVPKNSYGSYVADDGKSYVRTSGGDNWANTSFSIGKVTANILPIIATPTYSLPKTYSSSVYSSGYSISNTSKVYSIR